MELLGMELTVESGFFLVISATILIFSIVAIEHEEIIYAAFSFGLTGLAAACLFILLDAIYVAVVQAALYGGAISVLIIFGVLLIRREHGAALEPLPTVPRRVFGFALVVVMSAIMLLLAIDFPWPESAPDSNFENARDLDKLSESLWNENVFVLQIVALVLTITLAACVMLLKLEKVEKMERLRRGGLPLPKEDYFRRV